MIGGSSALHTATGVFNLCWHLLLILAPAAHSLLRMDRLFEERTESLFELRMEALVNFHPP